MAVTPNRDNQRCLVSIQTINLDTNVYGAYNPQIGLIAIESTVLPGGHLSIPARGEQWLVQKIGGRWFLEAKTDWADGRVSIPNVEGLDVLGTMNGPTHVTGSSVHLPEEVSLGKHRMRLNPTTGAMEIHNGTTWVSVVPEPEPEVAETRDEPSVWKLGAQTSVGTGGTYVLLPLAYGEGNDDYVAASGRIVLPYTGWYEVSGLVAATSWTGANPPFDSTTGGWVAVGLDRYDAGVTNQFRLAKVVDPKVGGQAPTYDLGSSGFKGTAGQLVSLRCAMSTSNGATLNFTTSVADPVQVTIRWLRGL